MSRVTAGSPVTSWTPGSFTARPLDDRMFSRPIQLANPMHAHRQQNSPGVPIALVTGVGAGSWRREAASRWKGFASPVDAGRRTHVHRAIRLAKIGYGGPHPNVRQCIRGSDNHDTLASDGHAHVRPRRRRMPGLKFGAAPARARADEVVRYLTIQRGDEPAMRVTMSKSG